MDADILAAIPPEKRIIAWHGPHQSYEDLRRLFGRMASIPAAYYKIVPAAHTLEDGLVPLYLLRTCGRNDLISYSSGQVGAWTRVLAPHLGCPFIYGTLARENRLGRGIMNISQLLQHYDFSDLRPIDILYGIADATAINAQEPMLHNSGYRELHLPALFLPFPSRAHDMKWFQPFQESLRKLLGFDLRGLTLGRPFKEAVIQTVGPHRSSKAAWMAKGANVMVRKTGRWYADTADAECLIETATAHGIPILGKPAAVVGCGSAGRAAATALVRQGARVTLINRGAKRGKWASALLNMPYVPLKDFKAGEYDIVVNATPVGESDNHLPFAISDFHGTLIDYASRPHGKTPLITQALEGGLIAIDGNEVMAASVNHQFRLMTGRVLPPSAYACSA